MERGCIFLVFFPRERRRTVSVVHARGQLGGEGGPFVAAAGKGGAKRRWKGGEGRF